MLPEVTITSTIFGLGLAGLFLLLLIIIIMGRRYALRRSTEDLASKYAGKVPSSILRSRNKYPEVDVMRRWHGTFSRIGLVVAIALAILAFNWTVIERVQDEDFGAVSLEVDIEVAPPRTDAPPPPPPPPPPPVIQEVPNDVLLEEDDVEFEDMSVDDKTMVDVPPVQLVSDKGKDAPPPPPPPPPPQEKDVEEIFKVVEDMPRFPGCENIGGTKAEKIDCATQKLMEYLYENLKYPPVARENGVEGTVVIRFVVNRDGMITDAEILRDIGGGCGHEALRVVNEMNSKVGPWIPGMQSGRTVRVMFTLPVRFRLKVN